MPKNRVRIVVVVEDRQLERFVRKTLKAWGIDQHDVTVRPDYPRGGKGSGKKYVTDKYPLELAAYRQKSRENTILVIATEADEQTVRVRMGELDAQAPADSPRGAKERVAYWVPKRHVETWGLHLTGTAVDEVTDYHDQGADIDWREAGKAFREAYVLYVNNATPSNLPSLTTAFDETKRLSL